MFFCLFVDGPIDTDFVMCTLRSGINPLYLCSYITHICYVLVSSKRKHGISPVSFIDPSAEPSRRSSLRLTTQFPKSLFFTSTSVTKRRKKRDYTKQTHSCSDVSMTEEIKPISDLPAVDSTAELRYERHLNPPVNFSYYSLTSFYLTNFFSIIADLGSCNRSFKSRWFFLI
jgi:hypothetical protein